MLLELLHAVGATVTLSGNGREALKLLSSHGPFDLVLMDMHMPDMDGLEATRRLRSRPEGQGLVVIATSANITDDDRQRCLSAGMDDFEPKPIEPARLYETLARWMKRTAVRPQPAHPRSGVSWPAPAAAAHTQGRPVLQGEIDTASPIDLTEVRRLFNNDPDKLHQVLEVFLTMTRDDLDRMTAADRRVPT